MIIDELEKPFSVFVEITLDDEVLRLQGESLVSMEFQRGLGGGRCTLVYFDKTRGDIDEKFGRAAQVYVQYGYSVSPAGSPRVSPKYKCGVVTLRPNLEIEGSRTEVVLLGFSTIDSTSRRTEMPPAFKNATASGIARQVAKALGFTEDNMVIEETNDVLGNPEVSSAAEAILIWPQGMSVEEFLGKFIAPRGTSKTGQNGAYTYYVSHLEGGKNLVEPKFHFHSEAFLTDKEHTDIPTFVYPNVGQSDLQSLSITINPRLFMLYGGLSSRVASQNTVQKLLKEGSKSTNPQKILDQEVVPPDVKDLQHRSSTPYGDGDSEKAKAATFERAARNLFFSGSATFLGDPGRNVLDTFRLIVYKNNASKEEHYMSGEYFIRQVTDRIDGQGFFNVAQISKRIATH